MNVRAADPAPIRTLVEPSHMDEHLGGPGPAKVLGTGPLMPTASADVATDFSAVLSPPVVVSPVVQRDDFTTSGGRSLPIFGRHTLQIRRYKASIDYGCPNGMS